MCGIVGVCDNAAATRRVDDPAIAIAVSGRRVAAINPILSIRELSHNTGYASSSGDLEAALVPSEDRGRGRSCKGSNLKERFHDVGPRNE